VTLLHTQPAAYIKYYFTTFDYLESFKCSQMFYITYLLNLFIIYLLKKYWSKFSLAGRLYHMPDMAHTYMCTLAYFTCQGSVHLTCSVHNVQVQIIIVLCHSPSILQNE
jgi:hypothetical protein